MTQMWTSAAIETVIAPATRDLGDGFEVRRALPSVQRRMIGPFVFLDQMGPAVFRPGSGLDVRPHPHIGLATVTYLFEGEILHRDSLGTVQPIRPGEVNWMIAGRGIAHSERTPPALREPGSRLFGIQTWVALPRDSEEAAPAFAHYAAADLPLVESDGSRLRLIAGSLAGLRSPVAVFSEMFYADAALERGAGLEMPTEHDERALYVAEGAVAVDGERFDAGVLLVFRPGAAAAIAAVEPSRLMLLGGAPLDGGRHIWWNFVSSSAERIEQAKRDWKEGRIAPVPGETDIIPLPKDPPAPVRRP